MISIAMAGGSVLHILSRCARRSGIFGCRKAATALERSAAGNRSNVKGVGGGVLEYKLDFGLGYRIYFGQDGGRLVILLAGGTKKRQQRDIRQAQVNWEGYRKRKPEGTRYGTDQRLS